LPKVTIGLAVALIVLGVVGFVATGSTHPTALIPAFAGVLFAVLGFVAMNPAARKHAMHAAAALALLGFLITIPGLIGAIRLMTGGTVDNPAAAKAKAIMSVLCLVFVLLCVRSFIAARRARVAGDATATS
jgi:hypothetical protein